MILCDHSLRVGDWGKSWLIWCYEIKTHKKNNWLCLHLSKRVPLAIRFYYCCSVRHIHSHTYIHTYTYTYYTRIHTYIARLHTYIHTYIHAYIHTCKHTCIHNVCTVSAYIHTHWRRKRGAGGGACAPPPLRVGGGKDMFVPPPPTFRPRI